MAQSEIEQWWEECHNTPKSLYISNSGGQWLWKAMNIKSLIQPGIRTLEIGIGTGKNVRRLRRRGCEVYALDITPVALVKVKGLTFGQWLDPADLPDRFFDLAISHLVTQHMSNADLIAQVKNVLRSLKENGIFAMQFADLLHGTTDETFNESLPYQQGGGVCRSKEMMEKLISSCGGRITWLSNPMNFPKHGSRWFNIHIRRLLITHT